MRLTIIPIDGAVYKDDLCYSNLIWEGTPSDVHALQWFDTYGWIEFKNGNPQEDITALPDWANNAMAAWQVAYDIAHAPPPPPTAEQNKSYAVQLLANTDWATIADVSDPALSNPYLTNAAQFITYRNQVRRIAINPVAGVIVWPTTPSAQWAQND